MNNPKIAVAVFVENAGWGGKAAASVAALVAERYLKRKTEAKKLEAQVLSANYMPALSRLPGAPKPVVPKPVDPKPATPRKDTSSAVKPLMTVTKPKTLTVAATVSGY